MNRLAIFLYEWKHFIRNPFKMVAVLLFAGAAIWALNNGASLHQEQEAEIEKINEKIVEKEQEVYAYYDNAQTGPEDRPWIDVTKPFWAIWNNPVYHLKSPSPAMVYSIGQAEQYGYYKKISFWSSPYDADLAGEIANPERLQSGTLDFSFVVLYLLPLLLLVCLHNVKGAESDRGILPLIEIQARSQRPWIVARVLFYVVLLAILLGTLLLLGSLMTGVLAEAPAAFGEALGLSLAYLVFWAVLDTLLLFRGRSTIVNTLAIVGVWILLAFVIPASVQQLVGISEPSSLMTEFIDAQRDEQNELWEQPDSVFMEQLIALYPMIAESPTYQNENARGNAMNRSGAALANELVKESIAEIETKNQQRNRMIRSSFWFNPVSLFQNQFNRLSETHYSDYEAYRNEIQRLIDLQIKVMVEDTWNDVTVDKAAFQEYQRKLSPVSL